MYAAGREEMRRMDAYTMETIGLPGVVLMENAGAKVVEEILAVCPGKRPRTMVLAGGGNNGGDGFVIARRLADLGAETVLGLLVPPERVRGDARVHLTAYLNRRLPLLRVWELPPERIRQELAQADVIVDAMLGTGAGGPLREPYRSTIMLVNEWHGAKPVVAVDVPSGLDSDDGAAADVAVRATRTVTFVCPKKGFFLQDGPAHVGQWRAVDISVPPAIADELALALPRVATEAEIAASVPPRPRHGHKGTFGHVLVAGGSRAYVGAPIYAAKAAIHSGAGLVTAAVPACIYPMVAAQMPEAIFLPLPGEDGHFAAEAADRLAEKLPSYRCVAVGPGLGRFPGGDSWLRTLFAALGGQPVVVDADALVLLRDEIETIRSYPGPVVFTPHPGEMAALLGTSVREVERDRLGVAASYASANGVYLLLKGHRPVIAAPDGAVWIVPFGHDALGKGGSGDVLTGLIASFLAQGAAPTQALIAACGLHARAGEAKAAERSHYGVMPLDLIDAVKEQLCKWEK